MSERYEFINVLDGVPVWVAEPGGRVWLGETGPADRHTLVIGDCGGTALAIEADDPQHLVALAERILERVRECVDALDAPAGEEIGQTART